MRQPERQKEWTALMHAAVGGDDGAYRKLLERLSHALRAFARRGFAQAGLGSSEVEDVVQETLLAIHLKRHTWDPSQPLGPWVMAIARNKLIDVLRRRGRRTEVPIENFAEFLSAEAKTPAIDSRDVEVLLGMLGERQRQIVRSIAVEGQPIREVAGRLGMSEGAVRVALHRCLKALAAACRSVPQ